MSSLTREQIMASASQEECKLEPVLMPAWGGRVYVKELSSEEKDAFEDHIQQQKQEAEEAGRKYRPNLRACLIVACVSDEKRVLLFQPGDEATLSKIPAHKLEPVLNKIDELNKFTSKHKEQLEKKYESRGGSELPPESPGKAEESLSPTKN